jgi:alkanesulfonate monooxygenase SsuD/methylene tetrahydromethanopterin reductase-like flavin-dependent oxidoreductase (luciferase family)
VKLGLCFDLRNPQEWGRSWPAYYRESLDLVVEAERLGLDSVWFTEHHFFADGYLPQTLTMAAAVAARTTRIRIGTAIVVAPLHHPLELAEQAAVVDILSDGRLTLGLGAGYVHKEFAAFGADLARRYAETDGRVRELRALLDPEREGSVTPPPVQRPFPIWLGYQGPQGARRAGRLGCGLLSLDPTLVEPYRAGLEDAGHDPASARVKGLLGLIVADDPDETFERLVPYICHQLNTYRAAATEGTGRTPSLVTPDKVRAQRGRPGFVPPILVCTPGEAVTRLHEVAQQVPVDEVYCWASVAGMPDDLAARHVELLATQVRPAVTGI